jgi:hypothetical protein
VGSDLGERFQARSAVVAHAAIEALSSGLGQIPRTY